MSEKWALILGTFFHAKPKSWVVSFYSLSLALSLSLLPSLPSYTTSLPLSPSLSRLFSLASFIHFSLMFYEVIGPEGCNSQIAVCRLLGRVECTSQPADRPTWPLPLPRKICSLTRNCRRRRRRRRRRRWVAQT